MERPIYQSIGTPAIELDTPALVVDLDTMQQNIETLHGLFRHSRAKVRPHVSCHQCPNIARRQLAANGTSGGIAVASVGEAQVFRDAGFADILVASQVVTPSKIRRLCSLARFGRISLAVDNLDNVSLLSEMARESDVILFILVEIEAGLGHCGVAPGPDALELARAVADSPNLTFQGLMAYEGALRYQDRGELEAETWRRLGPVLDTRKLIESAGLSVSTVSVGGTHNYDVAAAMTGVTEVQAGSYALMDYNYCQYRPEFRPAVKILTSVLSHPIPSRAVLDAGHKATGPDLGAPVVEGVSGATATRFSAEHGILELETPAIDGLNPNEKVWLVPFDLALVVNQYDYFRAVQNDRLQEIWPIAARGQFG